MQIISRLREMKGIGRLVETCSIIISAITFGSSFYEILRVHLLQELRLRDGTQVGKIRPRECSQSFIELQKHTCAA